MSRDVIQFEKGKQYRVKETFTNFSETFVQDQMLLLLDESHNRYDGLRVFLFKDLASAQQLSLEIAEEDRIDKWLVKFEEV